MKKTLFLILMTITLGVASVLAVGFDDFGTPEVYRMTFLEFALRNTSGTWVVVKDEDTSVNLASVDPGELAKAITGGYIPVGSYDRFRSTVSMFITIKGAVQPAGPGGIIYYTTAVSAPVAGPAPGDEPGEGCVYGTYGVYAGTVQDWYDEIEAGTIVVADYAECTIKAPTLPEEWAVEDADDVTINDDDVMEVSMEVDVTDSLNLLTHGSGTHMFPAPISIMVD